MSRAAQAVSRQSSRCLLIALAAGLAIVSALYLLRPIKDTDFFWHLKTGEWIFHHRDLPGSDPFSYTGDSLRTTTARFTLTTYWLSQLLYYAVYAAGGWNGVVLLRFVLAATLFLVMWIRRQGDQVVYAALLLTFAIVFLEQNAIERPQVLSFINFSLLLYLLDSLKKSPENRATSGCGCPAPLLIAFLMMVWSNVHGGIALGQATIIVYLIAEGLKYAHGALGPMRHHAYRRLLIAGGTGLAASLLNPNTYHALSLSFYAGVAPGSGGLVKIREYLSIPEAFRFNQDYIRSVDVVLMILVAAALISRAKKLDLTEALLAGGTGYFAFRHARYMAVFMMVALPLVGRFLSREGWLRWARGVLIACACVLAFVFTRDEDRGLERLRTGTWVDPAHFPVKAVDHILARNLRGNMYNSYIWGGYLIWRLAPERRVFVDGRGINPNVTWEATLIDYALEQSGAPQWQRLFNKYNIHYAVIPLELWGKPLPLVDRLSRDPEWVAVFIGDNSVVFERRSSGPAPVLER